MACSVDYSGKNLSYISRLQSGRYTDSDVAQFYIQSRFDHGSFIREVGDFVAHPRRDKGLSFDAVIGVYSQFAFFQRYQSNTACPLDPVGACEWWLRPYFERKLESYSGSDFKKNLKMSKAELKAEIASWFPDGGRFPTTLHARNPYKFFDIANFFCRSIGGLAAFTSENAKKEIRGAFRTLNIPHQIVDEFMIATAIVLNNLKVELTCGVTATISIGVSKTRHTRIEGGDPELLKHGGYLAIHHPDGPLEISIATSSPKEHGLVDIGITLLDTEVDTEPFFDRSLVEFEHPSIPKLKLDRQLQFEASRRPQVSAC